MTNKSVKVNCNFCGKEIECPEDMLKDAEKHACFECFEDREDKFAGMSEEEIGKIHVDYPMEELNSRMAEDLADELVEQEFTEIWSDLKDDFKESSKKELAEEMFWQGANMAAGTLMETLRMKMNGESGDEIDDGDMNEWKDDTEIDGEENEDKNDNGNRNPAG